MSGKVPSVHSLDQPEKLETLLKEDRAEDCLSCRIIGELHIFISDGLLNARNPYFTS
jgi:hypothetical protein